MSRFDAPIINSKISAPEETTATERPLPNTAILRNSSEQIEPEAEFVEDKEENQTNHRQKDKDTSPPSEISNPNNLDFENFFGEIQEIDSDVKVKDQEIKIKEKKLEIKTKKLKAASQKLDEIKKNELKTIITAANREIAELASSGKEDKADLAAKELKTRLTNFAKEFDLSEEELTTAINEVMKKNNGAKVNEVDSVDQLIDQTVEIIQSHAQEHLKKEIYDLLKDDEIRDALDELVEAGHINVEELHSAVKKRNKEAVQRIFAQVMQQQMNGGNEELTEKVKQLQEAFLNLMGREADIVDTFAMVSKDEEHLKEGFGAKNLAALDGVSSNATAELFKEKLDNAFFISDLEAKEFFEKRFTNDFWTQIEQIQEKTIIANAEHTEKIREKNKEEEKVTQARKEENKIEDTKIRFGTSSGIVAAAGPDISIHDLAYLIGGITALLQEVASGSFAPVQDSIRMIAIQDLESKGIEVKSNTSFRKIISLSRSLKG